MKATLLAAIAVFGVVPVAPAQTMVEYSNLATHSSKALAAPAWNVQKLAPKSANQYGTTKGQVWQEKNARVKDAAPSKPTPPAVFVLKSGERVETANYFMTTDSVRIEQEGKQRTIPMSTVDADKTLAANRERGVDLKLPANKAQITISF